MSGANSRVDIVKELRDAKELMIKSIDKNVAHLQTDVKERLIQHLKSLGSKIEEALFGDNDIHYGFTVYANDMGYNIKSLDEEDLYYFQILDTNYDKSSQF